MVSVGDIMTMATCTSDSSRKDTDTAMAKCGTEMGLTT